jgi:hypothetical protein
VPWPSAAAAARAGVEARAAGARRSRCQVGLARRGGSEGAARGMRAAIACSS